MKRPLIFETIYKRTSDCSTQAEAPPFLPAAPRSSLSTKGCPATHPVSLAVVDLKAYLNGLASAEPTPGGGSAAALVGAMGAALVAMVARITLASVKHQTVHADAVTIVGAADSLRSKFVAARLDDEAAYRAVVAAQALPRGSEDEKVARGAQVQAALAGAAAAPLRAAELAAELLAVCEHAARLHNTHVNSDVECAIAFGRAALDASAANVRINHRFMKDERLIAAQAAELRIIVRDAQDARSRAQAFLEATNHSPLTTHHSPLTTHE